MPTKIYVVYIITSSGQWKLEQAFFNEFDAQMMASGLKEKGKEFSIVYSGVIAIGII